MGKTKNKSHSEVEHLRGICKELEKENRSLKKQLRSFEKYEINGQDSEEKTDTEDTYLEVKSFIKCEDCAKGTYSEFEIMGKVYGTCNICEHRKRLK